MAVGLAQFRNRVFPTIPVPTDEPKSLRASIEALKRIVEMLIGADPKALDGSQHSRYAPHVFVQDTVPTALHPGDLWLSTLPSNYTFNIWTGAEWRLLLALP